MELPDDLEGAVVTDVQPGSPAAEKGLQRGDVIIEADHKKVTEPKTVATRCARRPSAATRPSCCWSSAKARIASSRSGSSAPERSPEGGRPGAGGATRRPFSLGAPARAELQVLRAAPPIVR